MNDRLTQQAWRLPLVLNIVFVARYASPSLCPTLELSTS